MSRASLLKSSITALIASITVSCRTTIPKWEGKIYAGDSASSSVQRSQAGELIKCSDPKFDLMLCMTGEDFKSFYETYVIGCQKWHRGMPRMSVNQAWEILAQAYKQEMPMVEVRDFEQAEMDETTDGI